MENKIHFSGAGRAVVVSLSAAVIVATLGHAANKPVVANVVESNPGNNRNLTVTYDLEESPGIVTFDI